MNCPHCGRPAQRGGLCPAHEMRKRLGQPMDTPVRRREPVSRDRPCAIPGCTRLATCWLGDERICTSHHERHRRGMADWRTRPMPPMRGRAKRISGADARKVNLTVPKPVMQRVERLAEARGVTPSTIVRLALDAWLAAARPDGRVAAAEIHDSAAWARRASEWEEA